MSFKEAKRTPVTGDRTPTLVRDGNNTSKRFCKKVSGDSKTGPKRYVEQVMQQFKLGIPKAQLKASSIIYECN